MQNQWAAAACWCKYRWHDENQVDSPGKGFNLFFKPGGMMYSLNKIDEKALVTEILMGDYRTADVFKKYNIDYCCGARWPLQTACEMRGLDVAIVKQELEEAVRAVQISTALPFDQWPLDFLTDYIIQVHHSYLRHTLPALETHLVHFIAEHRKKFTWLNELQQQFMRLHANIPLYMVQEEESIFPYIKQLNRAHASKDSLAGLYTRTLRKPVEKVMDQEHQLIADVLQRIRQLTDNYTLPANACRSHWVVFMKLRELDNDLVQHMHLERKILLPRLLQIESELKRA
jgi:regulator of cell morphogenesis and NO signaling